MKIGEAFPSKFLKPADLGGKAHLVRITLVKQEQIGADVKLVVYFHGKAKGLVLNVTNGRAIAAKYTEETDSWGGSEVELYPDRVAFNGQMVDSIRVRIPVPPAVEEDEIEF